MLSVLLLMVMICQNSKRLGKQQINQKIVKRIKIKYLKRKIQLRLLNQKKTKKRRKSQQKKIKYPNCLFNVSEKSFVDMLKELKEQKSK